MPSLPFHADQYRSPAIRDLVWALLSPTLINSNNSNHNPSARWYLDAYRLIESHLQQLDHDDTPLRQHLNAPESRRLGLYFERLWSYWLLHNGRYEMLAHNLQVIHAQQTLGAFDFIVHDTHADQFEHWELAVKFYLGIEPLREMHHWFGANLKDRLDLKYRHLVDKQLTLSETHHGRNSCLEKGWNVTQRRLISKGRLYYPFPADHIVTGEIPRHIDPAHVTGYWQTHSAFLQHAALHSSAGYHVLDKHEWLVHHAQSLQPLSDIRLILEQHTQPVQLRVEGWQPQAFRLFVVPDNWEASARAMLASH